ncbi:MAG: SGNH/GDSL hydrolase family protein [Thiobacillaceae bacterium]|jgi:phospholipase/lecithinase/hemolysin
MKKYFAHLATLIASLLLGTSVWATPFDGLYVFGDSLSDAGNNPSAVLSIYKILGTFYNVPGVCDPGHPCPPYDSGRYSNGPVAAEYVANAILPGGANPTNFFSFAVAGATTGIGNYGDGGKAGSKGAYGLPGIAQEIGLYNSLSGGVADPNALYFVWGGANDFLTLDYPTLAAQNIAAYVAELAGEGATHILVPNLPDLGLTPYVQSLGSTAVATAQGFSQLFNTTLAGLLDNLDSQFPNADIIQFDTYSFLNDVVANPARYGFTDTQDACLSSQLVPCANPNQYVFWDGFHPTTQADAVIAAAFASAVPEPSTIALLAAGLLASLAANMRGRRMIRPVLNLVGNLA